MGLCLGKLGIRRVILQRFSYIALTISVTSLNQPNFGETSLFFFILGLKGLNKVGGLIRLFPQPQVEQKKGLPKLDWARIRQEGLILFSLSFSLQE